MAEQNTQTPPETTGQTPATQGTAGQMNYDEIFRKLEAKGNKKPLE